MSPAALPSTVSVLARAALRGPLRPATVLAVARQALYLLPSGARTPLAVVVPGAVRVPAAVVLPPAAGSGPSRGSRPAPPGGWAAAGSRSGRCA
ncbi:hypothetical protein V2W30_37440 [Streptomyces sp. Q6]|uniref:Uncharacterized protein n=1 Tax=Streptomyces citrinus TaxID=3118173 RepID=A0ACD5AMN0_9ACTN